MLKELSMGCYQMVGMGGLDGVVYNGTSRQSQGSVPAAVDDVKAKGVLLCSAREHVGYLLFSNEDSVRDLRATRPHVYRSAVLYFKRGSVFCGAVDDNPSESANLVHQLAGRVSAMQKRTGAAIFSCRDELVKVALDRASFFERIFVVPELGEIEFSDTNWDVNGSAPSVMTALFYEMGGHLGRWAYRRRVESGLDTKLTVHTRSDEELRRNRIGDNVEVCFMSMSELYGPTFEIFANVPAKVGGHVNAVFNVKELPPPQK